MIQTNNKKKIDVYVGRFPSKVSQLLGSIHYPLLELSKMSRLLYITFENSNSFYSFCDSSDSFIHPVLTVFVLQFA